jgi:hypothetical protein
MSIMKQLIEQMIGDYLNESYEDDLVESIFEEVSEETWEAIEEAILNELSPELLKRYKEKAGKHASELGSKLDSAEKYSSGNIKVKDYGTLDKLTNRTRGQSRAFRKMTGTARVNASGPANDLRDLPAADFEKKYRMTKAEWERKNK